MIKYLDFEILKGMTINSIQIFKGNNTTFNRDIDGDEIIFKCSNGRTFKMFHGQECCESVYIKEIVGDLENIIDIPILLAEEVSNEGETEDRENETWTFYKLATNFDSLTISWYGTSNGYYSESVDFVEILND